MHDCCQECESPAAPLPGSLLELMIDYILRRSWGWLGALLARKPGAGCLQKGEKSDKFVDLDPSYIIAYLRSAAARV